VRGLGTPGLSSRWENAREAIEFAAFRIVAAAMSAIPLHAASAFSGWAWRLIAARLRRHQRALDNLALAFPDMSPAERQRIAVEMWGHLGRTFAEFFHMPRIMREQRIALEPAEPFEALAGAGPFVVCSLHMGNWEIIGQIGVRLGIPLAGTYQALSNSRVDTWMREKRETMYTRGLFAKGPATARALLRLARQGGSLAFLADLREGRGVPAPFFGHTAMSNPFPALIARSLDLPLYAARVMRKPGVRFTARLERVDVPKTADRDADVLAATANLQARFEEFVREAPEQWMWAHRRWD
jgi:KDO2-lipid IV(A) lauroyltransferase